MIAQQINTYAVYSQASQHVSTYNEQFCPSHVTGLQQTQTVLSKNINFLY